MCIELDSVAIRKMSLDVGSVQQDPLSCASLDTSYIPFPATYGIIIDSSHKCQTNLSYVVINSVSFFSCDVIFFVFSSLHDPVSFESLFMREQHF